MSEAALEPFLDRLRDLSRPNITDYTYSLRKAFEAQPDGTDAFEEFRDHVLDGDFDDAIAMADARGIAIDPIKRYAIGIEQLITDLTGVLAATRLDEAAVQSVIRSVRRGPADDARRALMGLTFPKPPPGAVWFALPFLALGVWVLWFGVQDVIDAAQSAGWAEVQGEVSSATIEVYQGSSSGGGLKNSRNASSGGSGSTYAPHIEYEYQVGSQRFTGDRVTFGDRSDRAYARSKVALYPAGANVTVHYDPSDPSSSVLETGRTSVTYAVPVGGVLLIGVGVFIAVWLPRSRARTA